MYTYARTLVTYCDILGFKNFVQSEGAPERIGKTLDALQRYSYPTRGPGLTHFASFSDLVVRTNTLSDKSSETDLPIVLHEVYDLVFAQTEVLKYGVFVRGALAVGDLCAAKRVLFGSALIEAYELERESARFPRIILSDSLARSLASYSEMNSSLAHHLAPLISKDFDGVHFIDYLYARSRSATDIYQSLEILVEHKNAIAGMRAEYARSSIQSLAAKIDWLVDYHNRALARIREIDYEAVSAHLRMLTI